MRTAALALVLLLAAGCTTSYGYIVRADGAPLYSSRERLNVVTRMDRLADGYMGHSAQEGDPVRVQYQGMAGWANRRDLRIFRHHNDELSRRHAVFLNRREVVLEAKDWPKDVKQAIRESRIRNGMTKEMVELAWGRPTGLRELPDGGEKWGFERRYLDVTEDVVYDACPGGAFAMGYGPWGPAWGYSYAFPVWEPRYYRTYYGHVERRSVTFDAGGKVVGWETEGF